MGRPIAIGLDLAKSVFRVHGVDGDGAVVLRRQVRRSQVPAFLQRPGPCVAGIEACWRAPHRARELTAPGHEVRPMPPACVKPHVKRGNTDAADAEAVCEAVTRPTMRFVPVKSAERQAALLDHRARDVLVRQRTRTVDAIRAHLAESGIVVAKRIHDPARLLAGRLRGLEERIEEATARITVARNGGPKRRSAGPPDWGHARLGAHCVERLRRDDTRCGGLPKRARLRRPARPDAPCAFVRRQGAVAADQQGGEQVPAPAALLGRDGKDQRPAGTACSPRSIRSRPAGPDAGAQTG